MNFIAAVNRVLRSNGIIKGDDDAVLTFSDTQHAATLQLAIIAIQDELNELISDRLISYERASDSITLVTGTRYYSLNSNFVRFYDRAMFWDATNNNLIVEYPGGEEALRQEIQDYTTQTGSPNWWYWYDTTTKKVAFYQTPDSSWNGIVFSYDYEKDVSVTDSTDTLPFQTESEAQAFVAMAGRRFKALFEDKQDVGGYILRDPSYITAKARIYNLMQPRNVSRSYSVDYR